MSSEPAQGSNGHRERSSALHVAVLAGGRSSEHEVSLSSAAGVRDGLLAAGHSVSWVEIGRDGAWRSDGAELSVTPGAGLLGADVAFPVLHGPFGEDGTVQGALETLAVPYVGSGVAASALSLDKVLFKELMRAAGVPQVDFAGVRAERFEREREQVLAELARLGMPVFVKPAHLGSSVGIVKVHEHAQSAAALEQAFAHDDLAIVEAMAQGLEVECAVLDGSPRLGVRAGRVHLSDRGRVLAPRAQYEPGGMQLIVPARIALATRERVRALALESSTRRLRWPRSRGLLRGRRDGARQRAEHDGGLHARPACTQADRRVGDLLCAAGRPPVSRRASSALTAPARCASPEQRDFGDGHCLASARQRGQPQQVVAVGRVVEVQLDAFAAGT